VLFIFPVCSSADFSFVRSLFSSHHRRLNLHLAHTDFHLCLQILHWGRQLCFVRSLVLFFPFRSLSGLFLSRLRVSRRFLLPISLLSLMFFGLGLLRQKRVLPLSAAIFSFCCRPVAPYQWSLFFVANSFCADFLLQF
jgi:hypothetical protein